MKTVSTSFVASQNKQSSNPVYRVYMKRRYWNGSTAYIWETSWTEIDRDMIISIDKINKQLDSESLSEFTVSGLTLNLKDSQNEWHEENTQGQFAADGVSSFGYEPYLTKIQIRAGFKIGQNDIRQGQVIEGTEEIVNLFTGVATEWQFNSDTRVAQVQVSGIETLALNSNSQNVSNTATTETIGSGDGVTKEFFTAFSNTFKINTVTVNAVTMISGIDYFISNLNSQDGGAVLEFANAPGSGHAIVCTYEYWKTNEPIENLIIDLLSEASISSYDVDDGTVGSIVNSITLSSKGEYDLGTNSGMTGGIENGSLVVDFTSNAANSSFATFSEATLAAAGWVGVGGVTGDYGISGGELRGTTGVALEIARDSVRKTFGYTPYFGMWKWTTRRVGVGGVAVVTFSCDDDVPTNGYSVTFATAGSGGLIFNKVVAGVFSALYNNDSVGITTSAQTIKIIRNLEGEWKIYLDSILLVTIIDDDTNLFGDRMLITTSAGECFYDDVYIPASSVSVYHESKTIDTVSGITAWGNLTVDKQGDSKTTFTIETKTSDDDSTYTSYTSISASNGILSAVKRYLKLKISFSITNALTTLNNLIIPKVFSYTVGFTSPKIFIGSGNFEGQSCYQSIQDLTKLTDFEFGFNDDEQFFFRSRDTSLTPDLAIAYNTNLLSINYLKYDYSILYSSVIAEFGNFVAEVLATANSRTSALEILGTERVFRISSGVLINQDTNVADALADIYIERLGVKRRRAQVVCKFLPQLELSDTVSLTLKHDAFNDTSHFADGIIFKVIGISNDLETWQTTLDLEEITS